MTKILRYRIDKQYVLIGGRLIFIIWAVFLWAGAAAAAPETKDKTGNNNEDRNIRISADKLITRIDAGQIEFVGNVRATQMETVITSDRLEIYYDPEIIKNKPGAERKGAIEKIIATGHVKIIHDDIIAVTDKAEYTTKSAIFILTGAQSRVTRGGQSITGTKFTLHRLDERLSVESDAENRVKAVIKGTPKAD